MKNLCLGIFLLIVFPFSAQTVTWDLSKLSTLDQTPSNILFGMYGVGYSYSDPYTNEQITQYTCFEKPKNLRISIPLQQATEVSISLVGLKNNIRLVLFLQPNEICTVQVLDNNSNFSRVNSNFASNKKAYEIIGERGQFQQAFSFLEQRLNLFGDSYTIGCFPQILTSDWQENWKASDSSHLIFKQFEKGLDLDLVSLSKFVNEQKLDPFFHQTWKEKLINEWLEKALIAAHSDQTEQYISRQFYAKYSKGNFSIPLTSASKQFASLILNNWVDNSITVTIPFTTILNFMDSMQPREKWEDVYQEIKVALQNSEVNKETYFDQLAQDNPSKYEGIAIPLRQARRQASDFHFFLSNMERTKDWEFPTDYKLSYMIDKLTLQENGVSIFEVQLLDSLFLHVGHFSTGPELAQAVRNRYSQALHKISKLPQYDNPNRFLPLVNNDQELNEILEQHKGKIILMFMLGHNGHQDFKTESIASLASFYKENFPNKVECILLTVDKNRRSRDEHSLAFAKSFFKYQLEQVYVVDGNQNSFWQDVYYGRQPSVVRMYSKSGELRNLGKIVNNVPVLPLLNLVQNELKTK